MFENMISAVTFNSEGLVPAVAQDQTTGEILMLAWMNREALEETLTTGKACYWSRSRKSLWRKGETSGQVQQVHAVMLDCDGDSIVLKITQEGVACHTGRRSCFYLTARKEGWEITQEVEISPEELYGKGS